MVGRPGFRSEILGGMSWANRVIVFASIFGDGFRCHAPRAPIPMASAKVIAAEISRLLRGLETGRASV